MTDFERALKFVTGIEGNYSNHENDPGGETKFGITKQTARRWGYNGPMKDLNKRTQRKIARDLYWEPIGGDNLAELAPDLSVEMFEIGFNIGPKLAVRWLQEWLGNLSRNGKDYPQPAVDGIWGPETERTLQKYLSKRSEENLVRSLNAQQIMYYKALVEQNPETYSPFLNGWLNKRSEPYLSESE